MCIRDRYTRGDCRGDRRGDDRSERLPRRSPRICALLVYFPQNPKLNEVALALRNGNFPTAALRGPVTERCVVSGHNCMIRLATRDSRYEKQQTTAGQLLIVEPLIILLSCRARCLYCIQCDRGFYMRLERPERSVCACVCVCVLFFLSNSSQQSVSRFDCQSSRIKVIAGFVTYPEAVSEKST